jgi:molybdate transport system substrate-binding protein
LPESTGHLHHFSSKQVLFLQATCKTFVDMKPMNCKRALALMLCLVASYGSATQVMVFAAASLTESLREVARDYSALSRDEVVFNFGGSSTLARQIEEGAPADLFFCADEAQMDRLQAKGLVVGETRTNLLSNTLVIVVAVEEGAAVIKPQDLATPAIRRIALGDPKAVPIGVYSRRFLQQEDLWAAVSPKVIATESVRAALAAVESGNADASIVYKTDAQVSRKVKTVYEVPQNKGPVIRYPAAVLKEARNKSGAERFLRYLAGPSSLAVFAKHGFVTLRATP